MPVLIGKIGKLPRKVPDMKKKTEEENEEKLKQNNENLQSANSLPPAVLLKEMSTPIPYKEPKWSGLCPDGSDYALEVLKSGVIVERVELTKKPYYVFGRLVNCDIVMAHPTISRHHSILQYKAFAEEGEPHSGWYLYDLGSTHGTYLNKEKIKANHYTRVKVGHQIKFGTSTRTYILLGPEFDCDGESELTVTEIKQKALQMKLEKQRMIKEVIDRKEKEKAEEERKLEEAGIDWGMGEDAEEEPDLADNPYASTANEELYLDDPKKTLRGYFEREGEELQYNCEERGVGQFMCRVVLPLDDASGRPVTAEVVHRGKKKDAVVACALEACRILDRAGLLRQAKHESRRRKARDWSADDFYDSDEDSYLDRTGTVERKRKRRMIRHGAANGEDVKTDKPLTYEDLLKQVSDLESKIAVEEKGLETLRASEKQGNDQSWDDIDDLEHFMLSLGSQRQSMARKAEISNAKMNIKKLQAELAKTQKLAEIARPAYMPPLIKKDDKKPLVKVTSNSVIYGKRIKLKHDEKKKQKAEKIRISEPKEEDGEFEEEMDSDEEESKFMSGKEINTPSLNMVVEASKQDRSFSKERQLKMEIDSEQNENENLQEDVKRVTKSVRSETKEEMKYCTYESLSKMI
ncbi:Kanadaptin [Eumeta japonica]|uniref:Kanadaptin n=1 Tax=Eumeta variegata TaxID=151549 RepID=A0A4C1WCX9_EUMVA|nr:Kanadaptin [Eumeta japonica]